MGLRVTGVAGVLLEAKQHGLATEVKSLLASLSATIAFRLSRSFEEAILKAAGEG